MPSGNTYTSTLDVSEPLIINSARRTREYKGKMVQLVDKHTLGRNQGRTWFEVLMAQLTSSRGSETTRFNNPQQLSDSRIGLTPEVIGVHTVLSERMNLRLSSTVLAQLGALSQESNQRLKDTDGLALSDAASVTLGGTGTTGTFGHLSAGVTRIKGNTTEPGMDPIRIVAHGFQIKPVQDQIGPIGTYPIPEGPTAGVYRNGYFQGPIAGGEMFEDGNVRVDSVPDAHGLIFAKMAIILVQGRSPWQKTRDEPDLGGGATSHWLYDEFVFGERSPGNWLFRWLTNATAPTS